MSDLDHEMIIGTIAELYLAPVFFGLCSSGNGGILGADSSYTGYSNEQKEKFFHTS